MADARPTTVQVALVGGMHFEATDADQISVSVDSSDAFGGAGLGMRPMELMLVALGSCTGMDVISILRKKRLEIKAYHVDVSGSVTEQIPHVYTNIAVRHVVTGKNIPPAAVAHAIELSETTYCPAYRMLSRAATITSSFDVLEAVPVD